MLSFKQFKKMLYGCTEHDNGYHWCRCCGHGWHMDDEPKHDEDCPMPVALASYGKKRIRCGQIQDSDCKGWF